MKKSIEKSMSEFSKLHKQIELIGIEVKGLGEKAETGQLELTQSSSINTLINELNKIGLQLINILETYLIIGTKKFEFDSSLIIECHCYR